MQTERRAWSLDHSTRIEPLLNWCLEHHAVDRLLLVSRLRQDRDEPILLVASVEEAIQHIFAPWVVDRRYASRWPGTKLMGHDALVTTIEFSEAAIAPMVAAAEFLRDWRHSHAPPLPEDLCLYRKGDVLPTLVSATHKQVAWLLTERDVGLHGAEPDGSDPEEFIPPAERNFIGDSVKYSLGDG